VNQPTQRVTEISTLILTGNKTHQEQQLFQIIFFFVNVLVNELKLFKIFQEFRYPPLETTLPGAQFLKSLENIRLRIFSHK
jgi:hypothetical protein